MRSGLGNSASDPVYVTQIGAGSTLSDGSSAPPVTTQGAALPAGTDRSGTAGTASSQLAPANTARRALNVQNISANKIGINEFGGVAVIGAAGTYTLAAGATINVRTNRQINVIADLAGSAYTATES